MLFALFASSAVIGTMNPDDMTVIWVANRDRGINDFIDVIAFYNNDTLVLSIARGLGWDQRVGRNRNIMEWRSSDDPAHGIGLWIGKHFSDIPEMKTYDMFTFGFHAMAPMSPCGSFGICDMNDDSVYNCLQGFKRWLPQEDWYLRDGKHDCERRTALDCHNGTDGFVQVTGAKLPDTSAAAVNFTMGLDNRRAVCSRNFSCMAYSVVEVIGMGTGCILWVGDTVVGGVAWLMGVLMLGYPR
ncbi:hypothetical protein Taro_023853 [Colocasia esculenta]|uniref:Apple domain-containing protein n=1 Tax=Colocasia esculenta TaxID=4460 RepID=A0A843VFQ4_COLES|nr:hypothetical protein [Colocasia esculenta]